MDLLTAFFIYLILWWVMLFTVLPFGIKRHAEDGQGFDSGAPDKAHLKKKLLINTVLSAVILAVIWGLDKTNVIQWHNWFDNGEWK